MDITKAEPYKLRNLTKVNILLGKNGCGKSTLLRELDQWLNQGPLEHRAKYITPERGGTLKFEANLENKLRNPDWLRDTRRANQLSSFREQVVVQFRRLELLVHRELESLVSKGVNDTEKLRASTFKNYLDRLNELLDNVELLPSSQPGVGFEIIQKSTREPIQPERISSGEAEIISLAIECLVFEKEIEQSKINILLLDSPDVHLHPDLQAKLARFLWEMADKKNATILIATHSTALLGGFKDYAETSVEFMIKGQTDFSFKKVTSVHKKILPIFGAHPLTSFFNETPIFLVEGDDEERIWQQAVRSSEGRIRLHPCSVGGKGYMNQYEVQVRDIMRSVYDSAVAYSLRDRDEGSDVIDDMTPLIRCKLSCRASENLLLSDDVLHSLGTTWDELKERIGEWITKYSNHKHFEKMSVFKDSGYDRKNFDLKELRNDLLMIMECSKPWEVVIGQVIAQIDCNESSGSMSNSLTDYLGHKLVRSILRTVRT